jgi:hypothetical protein
MSTNVDKEEQVNTETVAATLANDITLVQNRFFG